VGKPETLYLQGAASCLYQAIPVEQPVTIQASDSSIKVAHRAPLGWVGQVLLLFSLVSGAATHAWHLFEYPLYITDEGIYMEQAWSVLREGKLEPYTYFYDHAPAGWLLISGWVSILPFQFQTFGNAINTGRVLMLIFHILSIFLLFHITYRFSGRLSAAVIACFFFNFSPLAVYYQRQVLLDNIMVFWMLLCLYLITRDDGRILTIMLSGVVFGIGVLTKENAIFFAPVVIYLLYTQVRKQPNHRFALGFWVYMSGSVISLYFLYATLKNELLPYHLNFNLNAPQQEHVSLLYTIWWQLHRGNGSILDPNSDFWRFGLSIWFPRDKYILIFGGIALIVVLVLGWASRPRNRGYIVASLLGISYAIYLIRGSQMLEFYIVPLIPFLAMNLGILGAILLQPLARLRPASLSASMQAIAIITLWAGLLSPAAGYFFVHDAQGKTVPHDLYKLNVTYMQTDQLAFIRAHIPPTAKIIIDDDMWVQLHDIAPYYKWAHSHWKAASDPEVRNKLFGQNWRNIDYIVMSNQMLQAMELNNTDGSENYILEALRHSVRIWDLKRGGIELQIYQVQK
jgi:4-amino-4-deoxy-L-arabinose transferase-like glycosyltransferase